MKKQRLASILGRWNWREEVGRTEELVEEWSVNAAVCCWDTTALQRCCLVSFKLIGCWDTRHCSVELGLELNNTRRDSRGLRSWRASLLVKKSLVLAPQRG